MHQMRISTIQVSLVMFRSKKLEIRKNANTCRAVGFKSNRVPWNIEPNLSKDRAVPEGYNPSFWVEITKFTFIFDSLNSYSYFNVSTEVPSKWAVETLGDSPPAKASTQGLKCKTDTKFQFWCTRCIDPPGLGFQERVLCLGKAKVSRCPPPPPN